MMMLRKSDDRGHVDHGWLKSAHSFSFGGYYDPEFMGFGPLRVINEDHVQPGMGFGTHPHDNMEILTWVLDGALEHKDSMGSGEVLKPGEMQVMSAGTGIRHSEFNHSQDKPVHFLQMWVLPQQQNTKPNYQQKAFPADQRRNRLTLLAAPDKADGALQIGADIRLSTSLLDKDASVSTTLDPNRTGWLQLARGSVTVNDVEMQAGDGLGFADLSDLTITATQDAEFLLYDLPR
ncbi:MAG: pirin family protein [Alphaproteobacteria bacterium]